MLQPGWATSAVFDLLHLQFGFDARPPSELAELVRVLQERNKPFVYTVHDLRNPHHESRTLHDEQLDVLVPAADALLTLTQGAAAEIRTRWGREARVVPHPHVVDFATMSSWHQRRQVPRGTEFRVGLHVKSLRASMDPMAVLPVLVETVAGLPGGILQVNAHRDVLDVNGNRRDDDLAAYLKARASAGQLVLKIHDYLSDADLWNYLASLDVSVLPYRFGTHSGWLEACRDLNTTVIAPTCGYFAEQGPVLSYLHDEVNFDAQSLADAVLEAYGNRPALGASVEERRRQRQSIADTHADLYRSLLGC